MTPARSALHAALRVVLLPALFPVLLAAALPHHVDLQPHRRHRRLALQRAAGNAATGAILALVTAAIEERLEAGIVLEGADAGG